MAEQPIYVTQALDIPSLDQDINNTFGENSSNQRPDKSYLQEQSELQSQVDTGN